MDSLFFFPGFAAALMIALVCAWMGIFVLLKRITFISIALSQTAALGIAFGWFVGFNPMICAFILTIIGVLALIFPYNKRFLSKDSIVGFVYVITAAFTIILVAINPTAEMHGVNLFSGNLLYVNFQELLLIGLVLGGISVLNYVYHREFLYLSFDRESALTNGLKTECLDLIFYVSLGALISIAMNNSGLIFVFSSIIIPGMTALAVAKKSIHVFWLAGCVVFLSNIIGFAASFYYDLPVSPVITVCYGLCFLTAMIFKK